MPDLDLKKKGVGGEGGRWGERSFKSDSCIPFQSHFLVFDYLLRTPDNSNFFDFELLGVH